MISKNKITFLLSVLIIISAMIVINGTYRSRQKFIQYQSLLKDSQQYDVEWGQLLIEKTTLASFLGLESVAQDQLKMIFPKRNQIIIVEAIKQ